jgi:putative DNA primase/helicase
VFREKLAEWFPGDQHAPDCLSEHLGYLITSDNRAQKVIAWIGVPRAGKGTMVNILTNLAGRYNMTFPKLTDFRGDYEFGTEQLIGKNLAVVNEVDKVAVRHHAGIISTLKAFSGGDTISVNKRFVGHFGTKDVRFLLVGQSMPNLKDPSGALANRIIGLKFERSFRCGGGSTLGSGSRGHRALVQTPARAAGYSELGDRRIPAVPQPRPLRAAPDRRGHAE